MNWTSVSCTAGGFFTSWVTREVNGRKWRGTKEPLDEGERREWKNWLKTQYSKNKSWHPVPSLHGKQMGKQGNLSDFIFLGSKITADGDCSHEMKRRLLFGRKVMTLVITFNILDSIVKSRDITLLFNMLSTLVITFPRRRKYLLISRLQSPSAVILEPKK